MNPRQAAALLIVLDSGLIASGAALALPMGFVVLLHLAGVSGIALLLHWTLAASEDARSGALIVLSAAAFGPLGTIAALCMPRRSLGSFLEWHDELFPTHPRGPVGRALDDIRTGKAGAASLTTVRPFIDVMARGDLDRKRQAIALIRRNYHPRFKRVLDRALADPDPSIRVQASSAVAAIRSEQAA